VFTEDFPQAALDGLTQYGPAALSAAIVLIGGWFLSKWLSRLVIQAIPARRAFDDTIRPLTAQVVRYAILIFAIVIALGELGVQTTSILAVLGAAGLAIALALQETLRNLAAGIMLIWLRPLRAGEYIDAEGAAGTVMEIGIFATRLRSAEGIYVFVPNDKIWGATITNYSRDPSRRFDFIVGIAYQADIPRAREILLAIAHEDTRILTDPEPVVYVNNLGDSSVEMMLRVWIGTNDYWDVRLNISEKAKLGFDAAGIEIPFPQITLNAPAGAPPLFAVSESRQAPSGAAKPRAKSSGPPSGPTPSPAGKSASRKRAPRAAPSEED
jgi:small conductance mechanosensitive channel